MNICKVISGYVLTISVLGGSAVADIIQVPADFLTIQGAIDDFDTVYGDEIVVAPGTYNETVNFNGKGITVRSSDGAGVTTIDGTGLSDSVIKCISGEGSDTILNGFTITGGTGAACNDSQTCGGGMMIVGSSPTVINCVITGNSASLGAGMRNSGLSSPTVTNCIFRDNAADSSGGAMYNIASDVTVTNCIFTGNTATLTGGGMYNLGNISSNPSTITNCTFSGNTAGDEGGGIRNLVQANPTLTNCILWGNSPDQMSNASTPTVSFSNIQGGLPAGSIDGGGNIFTDPLFMDADGADDTVGTQDDDLRLSPGSPAIDAAETLAYLGPPLDIGGRPRAVDDSATLDTGVALEGIAIPFLAANIDMGAHEFSPAISGTIPAVSQWGLAVMGMLLLTAGTMIFARRRGQLDRRPRHG